MTYQSLSVQSLRLFTHSWQYRKDGFMFFPIENLTGFELGSTASVHTTISISGRATSYLSINSISNKHVHPQLCFYKKFIFFWTKYIRILIFFSENFTIKTVLIRYYQLPKSTALRLLPKKIKFRLKIYLLYRIFQRHIFIYLFIYLFIFCWYKFIFYNFNAWVLSYIILNHIVLKIKSRYFWF